MKPAIKVRKKSDTNSVTDISLLIESADRYHDWDDKELVSSIMQETSVPEEVAKEIATKTREKLTELATTLGWTSVSSSLIREIVEQELMNKGKRYKDRAQKYRTLGLSENEITKIIENEGARDNGNLGHNPDAVMFVCSETMMKQYALKHVFTSEVVEAHLQGDISIHDMGQIHKTYAHSKDTMVEVDSGGTLRKVSVGELWELVNPAVPQVIDGQEIKVTNGVKVKDRDKWVNLLRVIRHNETKDMVSFTLTDGSVVKVTDDHGCLVSRNGSLIITRADEVTAYDKFIKVTS